MNDDSEEDDSKKKKKREAKKSLEIMGDEGIPEKKLSIKKKSIAWSNIFGYDRKKKSSNGILMNHALLEDFKEKRRRKRNCFETGTCNNGNDEFDENQEDYDENDGK